MILTITGFGSVLGENTGRILDGLCGQVPAGTTYQYPLHSLLLRFVTDLFYNDGRFNISYSSGKRFVFKSSAARGLSMVWTPWSSTCPRVDCPHLFSYPQTCPPHFNSQVHPVIWYTNHVKHKMETTWCNDESSQNLRKRYINLSRNIILLELKTKRSHLF